MWSWLKWGNWKPAHTASLIVIFTVLGGPGPFPRASRLLEGSLAGCSAAPPSRAPTELAHAPQGRGGVERPGSRHGSCQKYPPKIKCELGCTAPQT